MWKRVKNGVQGRVVRFRVPGGAERADAGSDERPMPIAASILWKPIEGAAGQDAGLFPVFITQRALAAVHDHCAATRSEEHTSELQSLAYLVCRLLLEKKKTLDEDLPVH